MISQSKNRGDRKRKSITSRIWSATAWQVRNKKPFAVVIGYFHRISLCSERQQYHISLTAHLPRDWDQRLLTLLSVIMKWRSFRARFAEGSNQRLLSLSNLDWSRVPTIPVKKNWFLFLYSDFAAAPSFIYLPCLKYISYPFFVLRMSFYIRPAGSHYQYDQDWSTHNAHLLIALS